MRTVTSINNELIVELAKLKNSKYRNQKQIFLVEGFHLVGEAKKAQLLLKVLITKEEDFQEGVENILVTSSIIKKLSQTNTPQGIVGVVKMLPTPTVSGNKILLLDNVQDPGNIGTLIRTAVGFGIDLVVLGIGCADLYNDKVIRATQGALFHIPIICKELDEILPKIKQLNIPLYGTSLTNAINLKEINKPTKYALILGNEGQGVNERYLQLTDKNIYIEISEKVESLNVSIAGAIILYYFNE